MDAMLGRVYMRMLEHGVIARDPETKVLSLEDPSAAMLGKIAEWIERHKGVNTDSDKNLVQRHLERLRAKGGGDIPAISTEPDDASN